jgi:acid phosphatase type 7
MKRSDFLRITTTGLATRSVLGLWMVERLSTDVSAQGATSTLRPYLQTNLDGSVWVSWWTDADSSSFVDWGISAGALVNTVNGTTQNLGTNYRYHSAQITGLAASTYIYYRVRTENLTTAVFRFRTPPPAGTKTGRFRVLVIGDNQILTAERRWEKLIERSRVKLEEKFGTPIEESIDFVLNVGDQVDVGTLQHYRHLHFDYSKPVSPNLGFMTTIGNHETYTDTTLSLYKSLFYYGALTYQGIASPLPEVYYAYQKASILFIHLSSEHTGTTQANWVQSLVTAAQADSSVDFIISLCHRPYQAEQYIGDISSWFRTTVMPILAQTPKHVLTIGAHHHLYARGQTREWPCYHIISGASAWDQYWGQSSEADYDDVQKTVANWAWQLLDFDLANRRLDVECYAEANVRFPESTRWTTKAYNSRLIDSFHRQLGLAVPATPLITNNITAPVALPLVLQSSGFATSTAETLNSVHFQIAQDAAFTNLKVDRVRDIENLYGDTGAPEYEPVNKHASVDITQWNLATNSLPNGTYFARVRHRDTNVSWSAWSAAKQFTIQGSTTGTPKISLAKNVFASNEDFSIAFEFGPGNLRDWIGIYKKGDTPGPVASTDWFYLNRSRTAPSTAITSGSLLFTTNFAVGEWFAVFLANDGYTELAPRVPFFVGSKPTLAASKDAYALGETAQISFSSAPATATSPRNKDWIGVYRVGQTPGSGTPSTQWSYVTAAAGTLNFANLPKGYYFANYMVNDAYFEIAERVFFSVGSEIATVSCPVVWNPGNPFVVNFNDGPGIPKDYIGIFREGSTPGVGVDGTLVDYLYVGGATSGFVTFQNTPAPGSYYVGLFTNDSYTNVSNLFSFSVPQPPQLVLQNSEMSGGQMNLTLQTQTGKTYLVQRSKNLSDWETVQTISGNGALQTMSASTDLTQPDRCFFRVVEQ